VFC
jgi:hypothetical protein